MTRYTVAHTPSALADLARLWLVAPDRSAVTAASAVIDRELGTDADRKGQPFIAGDRIFVAAPLAVVFTVSPDDRLATIREVGFLDP